MDIHLCWPRLVLAVDSIILKAYIRLDGNPKDLILAPIYNSVPVTARMDKQHISTIETSPNRVLKFEVAPSSEDMSNVCECRCFASGQIAAEFSGVQCVPSDTRIIYSTTEKVRSTIGIPSAHFIDTTIDCSARLGNRLWADSESVDCYHVPGQYVIPVFMWPWLYRLKYHGCGLQQVRLED